jgi:hypothetical protein
VTTALQYTPIPGIEEFLARDWERAGSRATMVAVNSSIAHWCIFLEERGIDSYLSIDDEVVSDFTKYLISKGYKHGYVSLCAKTAQRWLYWMRGVRSDKGVYPVKITVAPTVDVGLSGSDITRVIGAVREKYSPQDAAFSEILIVLAFCLQLSRSQMLRLSIRDVNNSACQMLVNQQVVPYGPPVQGSVARWLLYGKRRDVNLFLGTKRVAKVVQAVRESGALVGIPLSTAMLRQAGLRYLVSGRANDHPERFIPPVDGLKVRAMPVPQRRERPKGELDLTRLTRSEQHQVDF